MFQMYVILRELEKYIYGIRVKAKNKQVKCVENQNQRRRQACQSHCLRVLHKHGAVLASGIYCCSGFCGDSSEKPSIPR